MRADIPAPASAGPSSAPLSSTWVSSLRRSWATSPREPETTIPPPTLADNGNMQYVDPKGQIVDKISCIGNRADSRRCGQEARREQDQSTVLNGERTISDHMVSTVKGQLNSQPPSFPELTSLSISSPITERFPMPLPLPEQEQNYRETSIPALKPTAFR